MMEPRSSARGASPLRRGGSREEEGYLSEAPPSLEEFRSQIDPLSTLYHTGAAARWRRKQSEYFDDDNKRLGAGAGRARTMEEVHGVDVSWLHHTGKGT